MYDFRAKYKESIKLDEEQFSTLCKFQVAVGDKKSIKMILEHLQPKIQAPPMLRLPPAPKPMKITVTIENPDPNISVFIGGKSDMGKCVREIGENKLFLKMRERSEKTDLKPFEIYDQMKLARD